MPDLPLASRPLHRLHGWSLGPFVGLAAALVGSPVSAAAQQSAVQVDSAHAQIRTTLRAFYFNLERRDWESLAADILSAKVMASHPAPAALLEQSDPTTPPSKGTAPPMRPHGWTMPS